MKKNLETNLSIQNKAKILAAEEAAEKFVQDGMSIGLGSGSTAYYFVFALAKKIEQQGFSITCVTTSKVTEKIARQCKIPLKEINEIDRLDLLVDGADEIDRQFCMIKGGGACLLWEKIVAHLAEKMIVICDQTKIVDKLGKFPLPIEVVKFGWKHTQNQIRQILQKITLSKPEIKIRLKNATPIITDSGNYILDCYCQRIDEPQEVARYLNNIAGIVEHGLFNFEADFVIVGMFDETVRIDKRK